MNRLMLIFAITLAAAATVCASDETEVMVPVNQFVDGFNKGDIKSALAACADEMAIIDEFPPHVWHGAGASAKWIEDFDADAKKNGITDGIVTLHKPRHIDVTGDRAYVIVPANYSYKQKGKAMKETGSMLTIALQKSQASWRITAWAWAKN